MAGDVSRDGPIRNTDHRRTDATCVDLMNADTYSGDVRVTGYAGDWRELKLEDTIRGSDLTMSYALTGTIAEVSPSWLDHTYEMFRKHNLEYRVYRRADWMCVRPACGVANEPGFPCWKCGAPEQP